MPKLGFTFAMLFLCATSAWSQSQYDGFMVFRPATDYELGVIPGLDQYDLDNGITLPDGRAVSPNRLGLGITDPDDLSDFQQYFVPDQPALGLAISDNQGGDDTFICCWWYFPQ